MYSSYHDPVYHDISIFTGNANRPLAEAICSSAGLRLGSADVFEFSNENIFVKINESVREHDCFVIQPTCSPVNRSVMELLIMIDALKRASAGRVTAIIPYYAYGRSDKKDQPRVPITGRLIADLIIIAGAHRVLTMDLHQGQVQGFFDIPVDHMTALSILAGYYRLMQIPEEELVVVSPDVGGSKRAKKFADNLGNVDLAILNKTRPQHNVAEIMEVIGDVKGKVAIMVDDMIDTAGTITAGAQKLIDMGAREVHVAATHAVLSGPAYERLEDSIIKEVVVTDTLPLNPDKKTSKIKVLSIATTLADTIQSVFRDESVSRLFEGNDQLF